MRAKESQEGDRLGTAFSEKLNKELLSQRSKNFRFKIKIRIFLHLHISASALKHWTPSCSKRKAYMLHKVPLLFHDSFSLVNSGCFEIPRLLLAEVNTIIKKPSLSNCLAPCRQNNLSRELQTTSTTAEMRWAQRGCLPSPNFKARIERCEQAGMQTDDYKCGCASTAHNCECGFALQMYSSDCKSVLLFCHFD